MSTKSTYYVVADNADTVFLILRADRKTRVFPFSVNELDSLMESYRLLSGGECFGGGGDPRLGLC